MATSNQFYILETKRDEKNPVYFSWLTIEPSLPYILEYNYPPVNVEFAEKYSLTMKDKWMDGDFYPKRVCVISEKMLPLLDELGVNCIILPTHINLKRNKQPKKKYYLFYSLEYLSILDYEKSIYEIAFDHRKGIPLTPEASGLASTAFEKIDTFVVKKEVKSHLFVCQDIYQFVCSSEFKARFEQLGLKGLDFIPLDENYHYSMFPFM